MPSDPRLLLSRRVEVLTQVRDLIDRRGLNVDEVRRELEALLPESGIGDRPAPAPARSTRVIAVSSGKGGVGKTTVAVNLALTFAQMGRRVALFDADLSMANVHILLGLKPPLNMRHVFEENARIEDVVVEGPLGVKVVCGGQGVRAMAEMDADRRRRILRGLERLERDADVLILDTAAGLGENALKFCSFADEIVLVTTPDMTAAADAYSIVKVLLEIEPESKIGVLANMVDNPYQGRNVFNRLNGAVERYLRSPLGDLGCLPDDPHVKSANRLRKPFKLESPDSPAARRLDEIAEAVLNGEAFRNRRKPSRMNGLMCELKRAMAGV
jgi:flagellar biosynthesis protein FlhG